MDPVSGATSELHCAVGSSTYFSDSASSQGCYKAKWVCAYKLFSTYKSRNVYFISKEYCWINWGFFKIIL